MVAISKTFREKDLQSMLLDLHDLKNRQYDLAYYKELFKSAFLAFGSSSPDNIDAVEKIDLKNKQSGVSIQLMSPNLDFQEIIELILQSKTLFKTIKKELPDLTKNDWTAALNFTKLLLDDFKYSFGLTYRMKEVFDNGEEDRLTQKGLEKINNQTKLIIQNYLKNKVIEDTLPTFNFLEFDLQENKETNTKRYGIRLKDYIFLSDLFSLLEEMPSPSFLKNQSNWEAFNRIMVLILLAFEGNESIH